MLIARLIADTDGLHTRLEAARAQVEAAGMPFITARMSDPGCGLVEALLEENAAAISRVALEEHFSPSNCLIADSPIAVPQLFVSDMDSTMIGQECIDELADFAGLKDRVADITERAMQGELEFESALRERVGLLAGLDEGAIGECLSQRITAMAGAKTLVQTLRAKGCRTVLVTGGFHHFADPVAEMLGFQRVVGNRLEVADGKLTGGLVGGITDSGVKRAVLQEEMAKLAPDATSLASGDGANDIPMLQAATYGFAYHAKPKARAAANGWVDRGDLTSILTLLGIPRSEWVTE